MSETSGAYIELDVVDVSAQKLLDLKARLPFDEVEALASEVISQVAKAASVSNADDPPQAVIAELAQTLVSKNDFAGADFIRSVRAEGTTIEDVYLKYLAAAARMLGDWWNVDRVSFAEVAIGVSRIYGIMRGLRQPSERFVVGRQKTAVFASVPGETHTLGVAMAADLFRDDGWDVSLRVGLPHDALIEEIEKLDCKLIGLSVSGEHSMRSLSKLVIALNIRVPAKPILVAGQSIEEFVPLIDLMGVEGVASTIEDARTIANTLI
ncbi:MAG: cobalamin-dependent protein [Pseudomonadota bacterium]